MHVGATGDRVDTRQQAPGNRAGSPPGLTVSGNWASGRMLTHAVNDRNALRRQGEMPAGVAAD